MLEQEPHIHHVCKFKEEEDEEARLPKVLSRLVEKVRVFGRRQSSFSCFLKKEFITQLAYVIITAKRRRG